MTITRVLQAAATAATTSTDGPGGTETPLTTPDPGPEPPTDPAPSPEEPPSAEPETLTLDLATLTDDSLTSLGQAVDAERERRRIILVTPTILTEAVTAYINAGGDLDELNAILSGGDQLPDAPTADTPE